LTFVVSQTNGPASSSTNIAQTVTAKDCVSSNDGIYNVKTQLPSKYFAEPDPADLQVDGVAILAFDAVNRRLVAVPIQQSLSKTQQEGCQLQAATADDVSSSNRDFDLLVGLAKQTTDVQEGDEDSGLILVVVGIVVLILIVIIALVCCYWFGSRDAQEGT